MNPSTLVPSFYFYKLADALSGSYTSLMAYSAGVIDARGNILKPESSIDPFEYMVIKLKKIIDQLPYGLTKAELGNYLSTIRMFSEEVEKYEITKDQYNCMMEGLFTNATDNKLSYFELLEDMSVGAGGGAPGSLGTPIANSQGPGVAGYDPKLGMPMQRRKQPKYFDNCEVFEVCPEEFIQFKSAKQWKEVPDSETKNYLQRFQRRNKSGKIGVKSLNPLNGENELYWINYPAKNFMEDVDFSNLTFLFEDMNSEQSNKKKSNLEKEQMAYAAVARHLTSKGFTHKPNASTDELGDKEFNIFSPAQGSADVMVGHQLSGNFGLTKIEVKYQREDPTRKSSPTFDVGVPRGTTLEKMGRKFRAWSPVRLLGQFGKRSKSRKYFTAEPSEVESAIPEILQQKGGIMMVGNNSRVHITHNEDEGTEQHKHDSALLQHLELKPTHTRHDLTKSGNPYIGNLTDSKRGRTGLLRLSAPATVIKNGQQYNTIEDQTSNAKLLRIQKTDTINPE